MKTTDTTVLDEPKIHEPTDQAVIEPAIESRPRPATGIKEAKIYIDGKFYSEANAKVSVLITVCFTAMESSRAFASTTGVSSGSRNISIDCGIRRARFVSKF